MTRYNFRKIEIYFHYCQLSLINEYEILKCKKLIIEDYLSIVIVETRISSY